MKRMFWFLVFLVIVSCGGGGGASAPPAVESNVETTTTVLPDGVPRIKAQGFAPIPEEPEKIVMAVNEDFAAAYPGWEANAQLFADFVNEVFLRTTKKRYIVDHFGVYRQDEISSIGSRRELFVSNNWNNSRIQGTTILFLMHEGFSTVPPAYWVIWGIEDFKIENADGVFNVIWPATNKAASSLAGNPDWFYLDISLFIPALAWRLGANDWWIYEFEDLSGVPPNLGSYKMRERFPDDPMILFGSGYEYPYDYPGRQIYDWSKLMFSDFNAFLINKNANYQFSNAELREGIPTEIRVRVVNEAGSPVEGAVVTIYGALSRADSSEESQINMTQLLETLVADINGEVVIKSDFYSSWRAKGVKAAYGGKHAGAVLTDIDLQQAYLMRGEEEYVLVLVL